MRGAPDEALVMMQQALAHAHAVAQPFGVATALNHSTVLHLLRGDIQAVQTLAEALITLASAHGLGILGVQGTLRQGWALAAQGRYEEGLALMQQALATMQAAKYTVGRMMYVALLAEQYGQAGQVEAGLHVLTEALTSRNSQEPHLWEPELYRVRGALLIQVRGGTPEAPGQATDTEAETCFQQALALAQRQGAKSFALRAVMGLSRLWQQQGKPAAARELLAPVYGWFTEGFDTRDLQEARALLDAL
jgi:predicted ATPase